MATTLGAIIIGDEILSGKRQDKHMAQVIRTLASRGLELAWCQYLGDDPDRITARLKQSLATEDIVLSFGGIGATPDDHTRQCAASALGVVLVLHPEAETEIRARFGGETTPQRLAMGEFPEGARIVPNPYNRIPGFSLPRIAPDDRHIELGVRGDAADVPQAIAELQGGVSALGFVWSEAAVS